MAEDHEMRFYNVIIDLCNNSLVSGIITYDLSDDPKSVNIETGVESLQGVQLFIKAVDEGKFWLLDENKNPVYENSGYVPAIMDYYNVTEGFGDYIDLEIINIEKKTLRTKELHNIINFNDDEDWKAVN